MNMQSAQTKYMNKLRRRKRKVLCSMQVTEKIDSINEIKDHLILR